MSTNIHLYHQASLFHLSSCPLYSVFFSLLKRRMMHGKPTRMHFTEYIGKHKLRIPFSQSLAHPVLEAAFTLSGVRTNARPASVSYTCKINTSKLHLRTDFERLSGRYFQMINNRGETILSGQCTSWKRGNIGSRNSFLIIDIVRLLSMRGKKML